MATALRIILIALVVWYLIRIIIRYVVPLLSAGREKDKEPSGRQEKEFRKSTRQGDVTITDYGRRSKDVDTDEGDYVDYEEVD